MDEFFCIERVLGEVAGVVNLTYEAEPFEANAGKVAYHEFAAILAEKKVVKAAADGEGDEEEAGEEPAAEEAVEEKAADFNPRDF
jgi:hypothetical protein